MQKFFPVLSCLSSPLSATERRQQGLENLRLFSLENNYLTSGCHHNIEISSHFIKSNDCKHMKKNWIFESYTHRNGLRDRQSHSPVKPPGTSIPFTRSTLVVQGSKGSRQTLHTVGTTWTSKTLSFRLAENATCPHHLQKLPSQQSSPGLFLSSPWNLLTIRCQLELLELVFRTWSIKR